MYSTHCSLLHDSVSGFRTAVDFDFDDFAELQAAVAVGEKSPSTPGPQTLLQ